MRSVLYIPASNARALEKSMRISADGVIVDLEDAVAPDAKVAARGELRQRLTAAKVVESNVPAGTQTLIPHVLLRVNGAGTSWFEEDVREGARLLADGLVHGLVLPKTEDARALLEMRTIADSVLPRTTPLPLWAMVETPAGVLSLSHTLTHMCTRTATGLRRDAGGPNADTGHIMLRGLIAGTSDLSRDLRARVPSSASVRESVCVSVPRGPLMHALGHILMCARAYGLIALDGVHLDIADAAGLEATCVQGRDMGYDGRTLIHPSQIAVANKIYGVTPDEVAQAREVVSAYEAAVRAGKGVAVLRGRLIENLHADEARRTLEFAAAIGQDGMK